MAGRRFSSMMRQGERPLSFGGAGGAREDIPRMLASEFPELKVVGRDGKESYRFTLEDIAKPTSEKVWEVYELIGRRLMSADHPTVHVVPLTAMVDDPEQFSRLQPKIAVCRFLSALITDLSLNDMKFTILDIVSPSEGRTRQILSYLVRFLKLLRSSNELINELCGAYEERRAEKTKREDKIKEMENALEQRAEEVNRRKRDADALREELAALQTDYEKVLIACEEAKHAAKEVQDSIEELNLAKNAHMDEHETLCLKSEMLTSQVATSPNRLFAERDAVVEQVTTLRSKLASKRQELADAEEKHQKKAVIEKTIRHFSEELKSIAGLKPTLEEKEEAIESTAYETRVLGDAVSACREAYDKAAGEEDLLRRVFARDREQHQRHMNSLRAQLETAVKNAKESVIRNQDKSRENAERQRELARIHTEMTLFKRATETEASKVASRLRAVRHTLQYWDEQYEAKKHEFEAYVIAVKDGLYGNVDDFSDGDRPDSTE